jgi:hypothetical protein
LTVAHYGRSLIRRQRRRCWVVASTCSLPHRKLPPPAFVFIRQLVADSREVVDYELVVRELRTGQGSRWTDERPCCVVVVVVLAGWLGGWGARVVVSLQQKKMQK